MYHFLIISQQNPFFFARLVLAMALSNEAVLVNLFLNDSLELIMVKSDVELQAANKQGSKEVFYLLKCKDNGKT